MKHSGKVSIVDVLKILRERPKGKAQRGQYLLAVGLDCEIPHWLWRRTKHSL